MAKRMIEVPAAVKQTTFSDCGQHVTLRRRDWQTISVTAIDAFGADAMVELSPRTAREIAAMLVAMADAQERQAA